MKKIILAIVLVVLSFGVLAEPVPLIMGGGAEVSCGTYLTETDYVKSYRLSWALGFLSALNVSNFFSKKDFLSEPDVGGITMNLANFCQKNPLSRFAEAVMQTAVDLSRRANK